MSLLSEYENRTAWKYEPIHGTFHTADGLPAKVDPAGGFVPFQGSTVVFRPGTLCRRIIPLMQKVLYEKLKGTDMLASRLPKAAIHMTLHDLISPEWPMPDAGQDRRAAVSESLSKAAEIAEGIREEYAGRKINMVADRIVNMVSKSLVLMLKGETEEDQQLLRELYDRFDGVVSLPYPLTPHITLAYFKPGMLDGDRLGAAVDDAQIVPGKIPAFDFYPEALTPQYFLDMRRYQDVPERICFCCDGGLNRSVMAANIMNFMAKERGLPVRAEARSGFQNTQGRPVPRQVWETLEAHGIQGDRHASAARYLYDREASWFTCFAAISQGAADRLGWLALPDERVIAASRFFYGVKDPEYGEAAYEETFADLYDRTVKYLDDFETRYCFPRCAP